MTRDEQLTAVRQKCVEANKESFDIYETYANFQEGTLGRTIRLADVLLAIPPQFFDEPNNVDPHGRLCLWFHNPYGVLVWNLRQDSLDAQSDETISFLHSLLIGH